MSKSKEERKSSGGAVSSAELRGRINCRMVLWKRRRKSWARDRLWRALWTILQSSEVCEAVKGLMAEAGVHKISEEATAGVQPKWGGEEEQFEQYFQRTKSLCLVVDEAKGLRERADPGWLAGFEKRSFLVTRNLAESLPFSTSVLCPVLGLAIPQGEWHLLHVSGEAPFLPPPCWCSVTTEVTRWRGSRATLER